MVRKAAAAIRAYASDTQVQAGAERDDAAFQAGLLISPMRSRPM
jgi:hypothetical protein